MTEIQALLAECRKACVAWQAHFTDGFAGLGIRGEQYDPDSRVKVFWVDDLIKIKQYGNHYTLNDCPPKILVHAIPLLELLDIQLQELAADQLTQLSDSRPFRLPEA